jgi:hypothetical protein
MAAAKATPFRSRSAICSEGNPVPLPTANTGETLRPQSSSLREPEQGPSLAGQRARDISDMASKGWRRVWVQWAAGQAKKRRGTSTSEFAREATATEKGRWVEHRALSKDHDASYWGLRSMTDEKLVLGSDGWEIKVTWPNKMQELELWFRKVKIPRLTIQLIIIFSPKKTNNNILQN